MADSNRSVVLWTARDRATVGEADLERNFELLKESTFNVFEESINHTRKYEVPNLAEFEAGQVYIHLCETNN